MGQVYHIDIHVNNFDHVCEINMLFYHYIIRSIWVIVPLCKN